MSNRHQDARPGFRRRVLLRRAGITGLALAASASPALARIYGNMMKTSVGYQLVPHGDEACGNCALFVPPGSSAGSEGYCKAVAGVIQASGWCRIWAPETGLNHS